MECGLWMSDSYQTVGLLYKGKAFPIIYWTLLFCVVPSYLPTSSCQEVALSSCFFLEIQAQEILPGQRERLLEKIRKENMMAPYGIVGYSPNGDSVLQVPGLAQEPRFGTSWAKG